MPVKKKITKPPAKKATSNKKVAVKEKAAPPKVQPVKPVKRAEPVKPAAPVAPVAPTRPVEEEVALPVADATVAVAAAPPPPVSYAGKSFTTAVEDYLRAGGPSTAAGIIAALEGGDFQFEWEPEERVRKAEASLARNQKLFLQLPDGQFGLVE